MQAFIQQPELLTRVIKDLKDIASIRQQNSGMDGLRIGVDLVYKKFILIVMNLSFFISSICVSLLQEFDDVFPDEISSGLPSIKWIEHQIDLVSNTSIPN
jgi:hypothetical protein